MDLPILSAALENLKRKWYEEVEINPETVLMDKKIFQKNKTNKKNGGNTVCRNGVCGKNEEKC